jgi:hypothetical protein
LYRICQKVKKKAKCVRKEDDNEDLLLGPGKYQNNSEYNSDCMLTGLKRHSSYFFPQVLLSKFGKKLYCEGIVQTAILLAKHTTDNLFWMGKMAHKVDYVSCF